MTNDYKRCICITNRKLVRGDFIDQMVRAVSLRPLAVVLREKDLCREAYESLAEDVMKICEKESVDFFIHTHTDIARKLGCKNVHFSIEGLRAYAKDIASGYFKQISVSCHSAEDVTEAKLSGATRAFYGNVFETDCKKGLPGKGLNELTGVCKSTDLPVFAIGGMKKEHILSMLSAGAAGICMMSGFMRADLHDSEQR